MGLNSQQIVIDTRVHNHRKGVGVLLPLMTNLVILIGFITSQPIINANRLALGLDDFPFIFGVSRAGTGSYEQALV